MGASKLLQLCVRILGRFVYEDIGTELEGDILLALRGRDGNSLETHHFAVLDREMTKSSKSKNKSSRPFEVCQSLAVHTRLRVQQLYCQA